MSLFKKIVAGIVGVFVTALLVLFIFRIGWVNYVDNYELGYKFDARTGRISVLLHTGYVITAPFLVSVHTVDLRPMQLCISANKRTLNCRLVKFNSEGLLTFVSWHGRGDYDIDSEVTGSLRDIMKSYAFDGSGTTYPFLTVLPSSSVSVNMSQEHTTTGVPGAVSR